MSSSLYRQLPNMDALLEDERLSALPRGVRLHLGRVVLQRARAAIAEGTLTALPDLVEQILQDSHVLLGAGLRPVINATGIVLHTNLGRAPWSQQAAERAMAVASGYCDLELDCTTGRRGERLSVVEQRLCYLTGAEAALVVNNCAAAVLLAVSALARGRDVIVSRGELVEIGGSFRIPDVIAAGGAHLVGVGTTNRTRSSDYRNAVGDNTALLLRVHPSNYEVVGFTERTERQELTSLAAEKGVYVVEDLGSGNLRADSGGETVQEALEAGVDVVTFSGDKLLGGPQAGLLVGTAKAIATLRHHPLYRALRVDKVLIAGLEATLEEVIGEQDTVVQKLLNLAPEVLKERAMELHRSLKDAGIDAVVSEQQGQVGGGSLPGVPLASWVVQVCVPHPERWAKRLRNGLVPIVARVGDERLWFDVRTIAPQQISQVAHALAEIQQTE